ncbi:sensor histidine kinase [Pedobacter sp. SYSU D00535]|uniref:sensor histidine kinase n=1 Tax=Pedobacter sp. SYSU D00535 TaxID=2810308 RepID=UPI001A97BD80|nr:sensor histidine kinase [Pedobacter sp. SYSU D00535]
MKISTLIFLGFSVVLTLSLVDSYVNNLLSRQVNKNTVFLANSESVIRNSSKLHKSIIDMQSAFRGYLLTDDENFLTPYDSGLKEIPRLYIEQRRLVKDSAPQLSRLDSIFALHKNWVNYANDLISSRRESLAANGSSNRYRELFDTKFRKQVGQKLNSKISDIFRDFDRFEYKIRETRRDTLTMSIERTETFSFTFVILTIVVAVTTSVYVVKLISKRIAMMVNLAESISKGKFAIVKDNKNDELTSLSTSLNIMSERLSKNIKELEKRNSELNQFAYVVSHDLKAPIRGIYNVVQWIEEDLANEISPQMRKYLSFIPQRINRMEGLIDGLLDYARISRDKALKEVVDVNLLLKDIVDLLVPKQFTVQIGEMPVLFTERIRLEQVFSNLISNSVKYTNHADSQIRISYKELNHFYEFTVEDNGIGIDPEYNDKIFEIFQTLREKNDQESTGIGLAIVKKIIDDQHCTIRVKSELGQGAKFIFTWPQN